MLMTLEIIWAALTLMCGLVTFFSLLPGKGWVLRVCDFPRAQVLVLAIMLLGIEVLCFTLVEAQPGGEHATRPALLVVLGLTIACQLWWAYRLTPLAKQELPSALSDPHSRPDGPQGRRLRLIAANVDYENPGREEAMHTIAEQDPDVIALIEPDERWEPIIDPYKDAYPHIVKEIRELGRGLALLSRYPILSHEVRYLVDDDRPSIWAQIELPSGDPIRMVVTHPPPPGLPRRRGEGRHSSRKRDIELDLIAAEIRRERDQDWVLTGDFNDVGWSATTLRAKRQSGLLDPRVGRGSYSTFPAHWPLCRYPIDHVLVSPRFRLVRIDRLEPIGSDHLALIAEFRLKGDAG